MIVRNMNQPEVLRGLYRAHGGGVAAMLLDDSLLTGMLFMAQGELKPGKAIELHADPYEEIYYVLQGKGLMTVGVERQRVALGDAVLIPAGALHSLENDGDKDCRILVVAALPGGGKGMKER